MEHRAKIRSWFYDLGLANDGTAEATLDGAVGSTSPAAREALKAALLRGVLRGEVRVAQLGISTTAGHDCFFNESFPMVFARHFGAVLATQRVGLRMRNHAIGNDGAMPSHGCAPTIVGHDNDVVGWDYSMMAPRGSCTVELFQRSLALAARADGQHPPATLWWQGGVYLPKEAEPGFARAPTNNAKQSCGGAWVVDAYASLGAHYGDFGATLRRLRLGGVLSLQLGTNPLFSDPLKGSVPDAGFREPELPRRRLARHHPGPELHRLWGLAWAHAYLGVLASALEDAAAGRFAVDRALPPAMRGCDPKICDSLPRCHTSMEPHSAHSLEQLVTHGLQKGDAGGRGWGRSPQYEGAQRAVYFGYIDRKIALVGGSDDGALTFRLDVREHGRPLVACQPPCVHARGGTRDKPAGCASGRLDLETHATWTLDGVRLEPASPDTALDVLITPSRGFCVLVAASVPAGPHTLTLALKAGGGAPDAKLSISHLIHY